MSLAPGDRVRLIEPLLWVAAPDDLPTELHAFPAGSRGTVVRVYGLSEPFIALVVFDRRTEHDDVWVPLFRLARLSPLEELAAAQSDDSRVD